MAVKYVQTRKSRRRRVVEKQNYGISVRGPLSTIPDSVFAFPKDWFTPETLTVFAKHPWVYASVRSISQNVACVNRKIQIGKKNNATDIDEFSSGAQLKLWELFNKPNEHMTSYQLFEATLVHQNLEGIVHWVLDRENISQIPESINVLGSQYMQPIVIDGNFVGWLYREPLSGEVIPLRFDQVLTFRFYNPYDPLGGMPPLEAARRGIKFDLLASMYGLGFFENGADPGGVLVTDKRLTKPQVKELVDLWEERHRGPGNAKRIAFLHSGTKYQGIQISQKDMEFIEQMRWTRDQILAVFKVPKTEISLFEDTNFSNAQTQERAYWQKTLIPIIKNLEAVIATDFIPGLVPSIGKGLRIFFDLDSVTALQETLADKIQNAERLYRIGYPINIISPFLNLGLPKVPWGDEWYPNSAVAPITDIIEGNVDGGSPSGMTTPQPTDDNPNARTPDENEPEEPLADEEDEERDTEAARAYDPPQEKVKPYRKSFSRAVSLFESKSDFSEIEKIIRQQLRSYLWRLRSHQLALIVKSRQVFDDAYWNKKLFDRLLPTYNQIRTLCVLNLSFEKLDGITVLLSPVNNFLKQKIEKILLRNNSVDETMQAIKQLFNSVTQEKELSRLSKLEVLLVLAEYAKFNRSKVA